MYTIPFFYKTKILISDGSNQVLNPTVTLLKIIHEYGLTAEAHKKNHIAFTFGLSFVSKINNGTNGTIKIISEGKSVYAIISIYNIGYSMAIYISLFGILILSKDLIVALFLTSIGIVFFSIQFYSFVYRFIKQVKRCFLC